MTVSDLIARLSKLDPNQEIMILDSFNGGGTPREINLGPSKHKISKQNVEDAADCEELGVGTSVLVLGFGCY